MSTSTWLWSRNLMIMSSFSFRVCHILTCRISGSVWYRQWVVSLSCTFQRAVLAALRRADNGSCHSHYTVLAALCDAGVFYVLCLFLLINVLYLPMLLKLGLIVGLTKQTSDGKEIDMLNCYNRKSCRSIEVKSTWFSRVNKFTMSTYLQSDICIMVKEQEWTEQIRTI